MGSILRNNRRMFWEILNRIIGRKNRIIGTGLVWSPFMKTSWSVNLLNRFNHWLVKRFAKPLREVV